VAWPALISLGVTILRLALELSDAPAWLASRAVGGGMSVVGISWLPFVFGPWFALRVAESEATTGARLKRLAATLVVYGLLARIPVYLLFFLDLQLDWNSHYAALPDEMAGDPFAMKALKLAVAQLGFWPLAWTTVVGGIAGWVTLAVRRPVTAAAIAAPPG
jgi:hypothetical protein